MAINKKGLHACLITPWYACLIKQIIIKQNHWERTHIRRCNWVEHLPKRFSISDIVDERLFAETHLYTKQQAFFINYFSFSAKSSKFIFFFILFSFYSIIKRCNTFTLLFTLIFSFVRILLPLVTSIACLNPFFLHFDYLIKKVFFLRLFIIDEDSPLVVTTWWINN